MRDNYSNIQVQIYKAQDLLEKATFELDEIINLIEDAVACRKAEEQVMSNDIPSDPFSIEDDLR